MDYYLKQATLIKSIAKKSNPEIQATSAPAQLNALDFGNNNDTDYFEQSKSLLMNFIQDPNKLEQIIETLRDGNEDYLKELTINWPTYSQVLQSLKGSVVSVKRVTDVLMDKLNASLGSKKDIIKDTKQNLKNAEIKKQQNLDGQQKESEERSLMHQEDPLEHEKQRESEEISRMGEEDAFSKIVDDDKRARDRKNFANLDGEYEQLVNLVTASMDQKYRTYVAIAELFKTLKLANPQELNIITKKATSEDKKQEKIKLVSDKKLEIIHILTEPSNIFKIILDNPYKSAKVQDRLQFLRQLCSESDYNHLLRRIEDIKLTINRLPKEITGNPANTGRNNAGKKKPVTKPSKSSSSANTGVDDKGATVSGKGLKPHQKVVNSKYYVNEDLLKNNGILEIRYVKNHHLAHVKPPMLSEKCKGCVTSMINGGKINPDHFVSLNQFEKDMLRKIDKLFNTNQNLHDDDNELLHKNFELLKGSYLAGNDSRLVKDQLKQYIFHAYELGKISRWNRDKMLFELKLI